MPIAEWAGGFGSPTDKEKKNSMYESVYAVTEVIGVRGVQGRRLQETSRDGRQLGSKSCGSPRSSARTVTIDAGKFARSGSGSGFLQNTTRSRSVRRARGAGPRRHGSRWREEASR